jgi:pilus assembly protein CpaB
MNRRTRHIVVLAVAIVTASLASLGVYRMTAGLPARAAASEVDVVVAARALPIGTLLTDADLKVVKWPASSPVPGAMGAIKDVTSRGLLAAVLQNEPITSNKLAEAHVGGGLPPAIPPGMRAMSVKVDDVIGVAGFIVPGSRVDVVVTMRRTNESITSTVASNVQVLAAGTRRDQEKPATPATSNAKPNESTVVTLMVAPKDAERIALAQSEGQIMLALRNPLDQQPTITDGVRTAGLLGDAPAPTPAAAPAPAPKPAARKVVAAPKEPEVAPPPPPRTVETIRAAKRSEEVIKEPNKEVIK